MEYTGTILLLIYVLSAVLQGVHTWYTLRAWSQAARTHKRMPMLARCHWMAAFAGSIVSHPCRQPTRAIAADGLLFTFFPVLNTCYLLGSLTLFLGMELPELLVIAVFGSRSEFEHWRSLPWNYKVPPR